MEGEGGACGWQPVTSEKAGSPQPDAFCPRKGLIQILHCSTLTEVSCSFSYKYPGIRSRILPIGAWLEPWRDLGLSLASRPGESFLIHCLLSVCVCTAHALALLPTKENSPSLVVWGDKGVRDWGVEGTAGDTENAWAASP